MKTLTEFDKFSLQKALDQKKELLAAGKTAEELPQAMGEALKIEGDKLTYLLNAVEVAEAKTDGLKRVVVYSVEEGKSAPGGTIQKGDKFYKAEFFHVPQPKRPERGRGDGPRGKGKGRGKKGGGRRDGKERGDRNGGGKAPGEPGAERSARPPRNPRPQANAGGVPNVKPNVVPVSPKAAPSEPKSE